MSSFVTALNCSLTDVSDHYFCLTCPEGRTMLTGLAAGLMHSVLPSRKTPSADTYIQPNFQLWGPLVDCDVIPAQPSQVGVQVPAIFGSSELCLSDVHFNKLIPP